MFIEEIPQCLDPGFAHENEAVVMPAGQFDESLGRICRRIERTPVLEGDNFIFRAISTGAAIVRRFSLVS